MKRAATRLPGPLTLVAVLVALYVIEVAVVVCAMVWYKTGEQSLMAPFTGSLGAVFTGAILSILGAGVYLLFTYRQTRPGAKGQFWLTVSMNAATVTVLLIVGETTIRLFSSKTPVGIAFADTILLPHSWDEVKARNQEILDSVPNEISYFVPDELLGWTVGPSRQSKDGLYSSSIEGARSPHPGYSYSLGAPARRIALVGDSFTFGLEVPFDESWGNRLQQGLGSGTQVLNFGVDGYGVNQAYLRYVRDVRPLHPDIVILGFINGNLYRSLGVYNFVQFPEWGFPFAKPRFVVDEGKLKLLNTPLPTPDAILKYRSITDLPFINYDPGFEPGEWQWRSYDRSHLVRFLLSRFPRWPQRRPQVSEEVTEVLNREIFKSFASSATAEGSIPLIVYFPNRNDFLGQNRDLKKAIEGSLHEHGIEFLDLTTCLSSIHISELFLHGPGHYTPRGNAAVARCLHPTIRNLLGAEAQPRGLAQESPEPLRPVVPLG